MTTKQMIARLIELAQEAMSNGDTAKADRCIDNAGILMAEEQAASYIRIFGIS